jgi:acyl dehydratase
VDSFIRARHSLMAADLKNPNTIQIKRKVTVELKGSDKPVCIAESLTRLMYS